jgi:cell division septation protein DedD
MAISLKNLSVQADALRAKLKAEQDAKEQKAAPKTNFDEGKFKPELIGVKTNYVLRILPNTFVNDGADEPWVRTLVHIFPAPNSAKKKFALCPTTLDEKAPCPLCEKARVYFKKVNDKTATKAEEETARAFYRKPRYFVNVLVVDDPRPIDKGNQKGKVLVWELGPQLHERLKEALVEQGKVFYDVSAGYNFNLVIKKKGEHPNYESSFFAAEATPIANDDAELDRISTAITDLQKFAVGRGPRSYADLQAMMEGREPVKMEREYDSATGQTTSRPMNARPALDENIDLNVDAPKPEAKAATAAASTPAPKAAPKPAPKAALTDDELLAQLDDLTESNGG